MRTLLLTALLAVAGTAQAADGALDDAFGTDAEFPGFGFYLNPYGTGLTSGVAVVRQAPNGQLYVFGSVNDGPNTGRISLRRLDADGYPDFGFGDSGLRTYQRPCTGGYVSDAQIDAQGRLWASFAGCPDFTLYRFTASGDLDTSLLGSGVLTIPFDLGDDNMDSARRIALTPEGGVIVAGFAAAAPVQRLAIAHYTGNGQPKPGFGVNGKVDFTADLLFNAVKGLYLMADGRIVVEGRYAPNPLDTKQSVMRLQASGAPDASFGNYAPGVSHADIGNLLGDPSKRMASEGSLLLSDGSLLQVGGGRYNGVHSSFDFAIVKWRPDGQIDTTFAPAGLRSYSLDFAGPVPASDDDNFDQAYAIVRQGDGKYLVVGRSSGSDGRLGIGAIRLTRNFDLDPSFGSGGKIRHLSAIAPAPDHFDCSLVSNVLLQPGRIVLGATVCTGSGVNLQATVGLTNDLLFADGFD